MTLYLFDFNSEYFFFSLVSTAGGFFLIVGWLLNQFIGMGGIDLEDVEAVNDLETDFDIVDKTDFVIDNDYASMEEVISDSITGMSYSEMTMPVPSLFSFRIIRVMMFFFGIGGNVGLFFYEFSFEESLVLAFITAFVSGYIVYKGLKFVYDNSIYNYKEPNLIDKIGTVITSIPVSGTGQIVINSLGARIYMSAKSINNIEIVSGTTVIVKDRDRNICFVEPFSPF